ncbi:hypothetical protein FACS1894161_4070 [Spirochaetia bacterium]|nr:hypothetical protein FACS1894161_4070 [Spirochaetia bacterium]
MTNDYGYFSAFQNPLLGTTRIILLHGIHTLGVLGATRIFDGCESNSIANLNLLNKYFNERPDKLKYNFETFFEVKVTRGVVSCPLLDDNSIFLFDGTS